MKQTISDKGFIKLYPDDGMVLTNGTIISTSVFAPMDADLSVWSEITEAEGEKITQELKAKEQLRYEEMLKAQEALMQEEAHQMQEESDVL